MIGNLYIIRNNINDKVYIGKTYKTIEQRFMEHKRDAEKAGKGKKHDCKFYRAMRKYGFENFHISLINTFEEGLLEEKEIEYIAKYNSYYNGYNSTLGGDGNKILELDEDAVIEEWNNGNSIKKIAKIFSVSTPKISDILKNKNIDTSKNKTRPTTLICYDLEWNRLAILTSREKQKDYVKAVLKHKVRYDYPLMFTQACELNVKRMGAFWQNREDVLYNGLEFNTKFDKEKYITGSKCININGIWFCLDRPGFSLDINTGKLTKIFPGKFFYTDDETVFSPGYKNIIIPTKEKLESIKDNPLEDIMKELKSSKGMVKKYFSYHNIKITELEENKKHLKELQKNRPTKEELEKFANLPYVRIAKIYNVSDNAVKKWFIKYGIEHKHKKQ